MFLVDLMPKPGEVWKFWIRLTLVLSFAIIFKFNSMKLGPGYSALFFLSKSYSMDENGDDYGTLQ